MIKKGLTTMPIPAETLTSMLLEAFPDAEINVTSLVDDNDHFHVTIKSGAFLGKSRVSQHQMVYKALNGKVGGELHALSLTTQPLENA